MVAVVSIQRVKKLIKVPADSLKVYELFVVGSGVRLDATHPLTQGRQGHRHPLERLRRDNL